jgi:hypothetical protein
MSQFETASARRQQSAHEQDAQEDSQPASGEHDLMHAAALLAHAQASHDAPSASDRAFNDTAHAPAPAHEGHSSHDGGFTGFGAEFQPYSYTDHHINHHRLDSEVRKLGVQHTRIFVPWGAVRTALAGKAGPDEEAAYIDTLNGEIAQHPNDDKLKRQLVQAKKDHAQFLSYSSSFEQTVELAGKHTTINLTFCGGNGHPDMIDQLSGVVRYLVGKGYTRLQVTLENEPNGPDRGNGFRGDFNRGVRHHNRAEMDKGLDSYVAEYQRLDQDLRGKTDPGASDVRDRVQVVGGDMVGNYRKQFFQEITRLGLNKYVDAYSFHTYFGAGWQLGGALSSLANARALGARYAKGKALQITEFGKERFTTKAERARDPSHKGVHAVEQGTEAAFEQGVFALSAINMGFVGVVKWDAFYGGEHHKGDGKGDPGQFYMIAGPARHYATDAMYRLMRMFTHATEPGWHVHGANHGVGGAEAHFRSADGKDGAILSMKKGGGVVSTAGLPHHRLFVTTWNANGRGGLGVRILPAGHHEVHVPVRGAVAISTKPLG